MYKDFLEIKSKCNYTTLIDIQPSFSLQVRRILMKIRTCMSKYSVHISALKLDSKAQDMPRITYNEFRFEITPDPIPETEKVL